MIFCGYCPRCKVSKLHCEVLEEVSLLPKKNVPSVYVAVMRYSCNICKRRYEFVFEIPGVIRQLDVKGAREDSR